MHSKWEMMEEIIQHRLAKGSIQAPDLQEHGCFNS